ncbi:UNVERIFIED_CONTAM: hypothetical protein RMT77_006440 [Armadillidium vulgare]
MAAIDKTASNSIRMKSSRLSLKAQKNLSDISPAPVPRSSHRIRSSSAEFDEKVKTNSASKRGQAGSPTVSQLNQSQTNVAEHKEDIHHSLFNGFNSSGRVHGICPLANLGNTCFLNSVLYALRFLPGFVHDLHHMYSYLQISSNQNVTSSLSQRMNFLSELHNVFTLLKKEECNISEGKKIPALHPLQFLESLRSVNPQFEGNKQQDAHELLHCLLDQLFNLPQDYVKNENSIEESLKPPKSKKRKRNMKILKDLNSPKIFDIVGSKFVGQMSLETRCVECEQINRREENFLEVCVPVKTKSDLDDDEELSDTDILLTALCTEEGLVGSNKYWCDFCHHHNEAERSVHYRQLPHNLLIHVKRFSSYSRTFATKCCDAMPAPFQLPCFCYECLHQDKEHKKGQNGFKFENADHEEDLSASHLPYFLTAFVCHLGATISSGHYISFVYVNSRSLSSCLEKQLETEENISKNNFECSFLRCCSSHLDRLLSSGICNGKDGKGFSVPIPSEGVWLECDDDKIKVVSFAEVSAVMTSNNLTPYLLFYSRCR